MPWITFYGAYLPQLITRLETLERRLIASRSTRAKRLTLIALWTQLQPDIPCPYV